MVQVEGVVAVVEVAGARGGGGLAICFVAGLGGGKTYQSPLLYSLALGRAAVVRPMMAAKVRTRALGNCMIELLCWLFLGCEY